MTDTNSKEMNESPVDSEQMDQEINLAALKELSSLSGGGYKPSAPSMAFRTQSLNSGDLDLKIDRFDPSKVRELAGTNCTITGDNGPQGCPG